MPYIKHEYESPDLPLNTIIIRPVEPGDCCDNCGALIADSVTEIKLSPVESRFFCCFCLADPDTPIPIALTDDGHAALYDESDADYFGAIWQE